VWQERLLIAILSIFLNMIPFGLKKWLLYSKLWKIKRINLNSSRIIIKMEEIIKIAQNHSHRVKLKTKNKVKKSIYTLTQYWIKWTWHLV
jgi:hypothetical protein